MKIIVNGASLSGKTALVLYLRDKTDFPIREIDEELTELNGGEFPVGEDLKKNILTLKVVKKVIAQDKIIFFTNTDYFTSNNLRDAREKGFKILQLDLALVDLLERNEYRMKNQGYGDMSQWLAGMVDYQKKIRDEDLVDTILDASKPTSEIAKEIFEIGE